MKLLEKAEKILNGGECSLITSEDIWELQTLTAIPQLITELEVHERLDESSGLSSICVKKAHNGCILVFQEIQKRLDALLSKGTENFKKLEKEVIGEI